MVTNHERGQQGEASWNQDSIRIKNQQLIYPKLCCESPLFSVWESLCIRNASASLHQLSPAPKNGFPSQKQRNSKQLDV